MKNIIAAIAGGFIILVWGFISWTVLPWHEMNSFTDENAVIQVMIENAPSSGIYHIPSDMAEYTKDEPAAFVNVLKDGYGSGMGEMMIKGLIGNIIIAFLAILLLNKTANLNYVQKVGFITLTGLLIGAAANFPSWNWFGFPTMYSIMNIIDTIITWLLAGLVIAKLIPNNE